MPGADPTHPITAGRMLGGRYRLVVKLARGGMAEVWEAHDEVLSRPVAVKILQAHLASDGVFLERFRREAVTAARMAHPSVVATYDTGMDSGTPYIVMELVPGETLRQALSARGPLEPRTALNIARQIANALSEAHRAGLVHRDIKPANILLVDDGWGGLRVKVTDFGIAKASEGLGADLTKTGTVLGTPKYLSPEQIRGLEPDSRADLYSLGVVLFEMLTGEPPYSGATDMATALAHLNDEIPSVSSRLKGIPPAVDELNADLLAKDPSQRIPSAAAVCQRIDGLPPMPAAASLRAGSGRSRDRVDAALSQASTRSVRAGFAAEAPTDVINGTATGAALSGGGTVAMEVGGPGTDPYGTDAARGPRAHQTGGRTRRRVAMVVGALLLAGAITALALLSVSGSPSRGLRGTSSSPPGQARLAITSVAVFMVNDRPPDNAGDARFAVDGNPTTYWPTDEYHSARFGNLYPGIGLAIHLSQSEQGRSLVVLSPNSGWAAETFVSASPVSSGQPVTAWGAPTDSKTDIPPGTTSFRLGNRNAQWVLLWITDLGAPVGSSYEGRIAEMSIR